jgi:outer membrane lipoprotein-sorting protein
MNRLTRTIGILLLLILASSVYAQSIDEILAKHFEAINQEKLSSVKSIKIQAKMSMMGQEMPMTVMQKRPAKIRSDIEMQGKKIITIYNGKEGWMINPMMGSTEPQKIPDAQLEAALSETNFFDSEINNYAEKGHSVEKLDDGEVQGKSAYVLQLNHKNGTKFKFYFDKSDYLILKTTAKVSQMGMEIDVESFNKDYKKVDDILFAHTVEVHSNGQLFQTTKMTSIELNKDIEDSLFEKSSLSE